MAKIEKSKTTKLKGRKRKHSCTGTEDEVANKSVIVEAHVEPKELVISTESVNRTKTKKRKNKTGGDIQEKRSKTLSSDTICEPINNDHEANDYQEPSPEELKESEKPENNLAIITGRQKKKQKHQKSLLAKKGQSIEKEKERNAEYLKKWKHNRECWKFEKLRQISIQQTMFDNDKLNENVWSIALEYLAGSKGAARAKIVKLASDVIDEVDKISEEQEADKEKESNVDSVKYQRARDLLQTLN